MCIYIYIEREREGERERERERDYTEWFLETTRTFVLLVIRFNALAYS